MPFLDRMSGKTKPKKSIFDLAGYKEAVKNPYVKQALGPVADAMSSPKIPEGVNADKAKPYLPLFEQAAEDTGIDRDILLKQAWQESKFDPNAGSSAGAKGIMQLLPKYHKDVDALDPNQAIPYGARYLKEQLDRFDGDIRKALAAYNAGPTKLSEIINKHGNRWEEHLPVETKDYLKKILSTQEGLVKTAVKEKPIDKSRPILKNEDGSFSTEETITIGVDDKFIVIPTIVNGKRHTDKEAIDLFFKGENKSVIEADTLEEAEEAAQKRTKRIGKERGREV